MNYSSDVAKKKALLVKTTLRLRDDLHEQARIQAIKKKTTLQAIVNEALAEYLKRK